MAENSRIFLNVAILAVALYQTVSGELVAFTAGQDSHLDITNSSTTLPFSKLITEHNSQLVDGVFTCQHPGIYKFQVYSVTQNDASVYLDIFLNSNAVATLWAHSPNDYASAGNVVILRLNQGDTVQVESRGSHVTTYGKPGQIYTTITGIQLKEYEQGTTPLTSFSAVVTNHQDVQSGANVLYDSELIDTDDAYDNTSGIFTAPSSGIYAFYFFSLARSGEELWQELYHNDQYVCSLYGKAPNEYADAGNSVILHLKAGDQITVKAHQNRPNGIYGKDDQMYTSFSGYELVTESDLDNIEADPSVYFSAGLSQSTTFQNHEKVVFDRVFSDHGTFNHYNHLTGEFTAPKTGTYEFNYHALSQKSQAIWLELYRNYIYVDSLYSHLPDGYAAAGNAAVIDLDQGDVVYIRAHGTNALFGTNGQVYCTFYGALIRTPFSGNVIVGK